MLSIPPQELVIRCGHMKLWPQSPCSVWPVRIKGKIEYTDCSYLPSTACIPLSAQNLLTSIMFSQLIVHNTKPTKDSNVTEKYVPQSVVSCSATVTNDGTLVDPVSKSIETDTVTVVLTWKHWHKKLIGVLKHALFISFQIQLECTL
jgi:hypothetical protein